MGFLDDAYRRATGEVYMAGRLTSVGAPDMGESLSAYARVNDLSFNYWTVRATDGLFQDWDAQANLLVVLREMGLFEHIRDPHLKPAWIVHRIEWVDGPGPWFESWADELQVAVKVAQHIEATPNLWEYLRAWEAADTAQRRAKEKERAAHLTAIVTGGIGAIVTAAIVTIAGNDTPGDREVEEAVAAQNAETNPFIMAGAVGLGVVAIIGAFIWLG